MKLKYIPLVLISIAMYTLITYFVGNFIYKGMSNYISIGKIQFIITLVIISISYLISMALGKFLPAKLDKFFMVVGSYWMAFFMYALIIFPLVILLNIILSKFNFYESYMLKINLVETILVISLFVFIGISGYFNANRSYVNLIKIPIEETTFKKNLNIVMVSDIHLGKIIGNSHLEKMVNEINDLNPDIIIIAGDVIDTDIRPFLEHNMAEKFSELNSKYGTFLTLGNHDLMTNSTHEIVSSFEKNNVNVVRDNAVLVDNSFYIVGRDDISINRYKKERATLNSILEPLDILKPRIVVDHTPSALDESYNSEVDMHFSGHTHGGQLNPCNLITKKMFEIDRGYLKKDKSHIIVSSGYGTWGPPIRIGTKSEIVNVIIE